MSEACFTVLVPSGSSVARQRKELGGEQHESFICRGGWEQKDME